MVQSLKLGGAANEHAQTGMRRINRLPIVIVIVLVTAFLGIIFYGLSTRGLFFKQNASLETSTGTPASTYADQIKRGVTDGIIGDPEQQVTYQPTPVERQDDQSANPFVAEPASREQIRKTQELEPDSVWRARLQREQQERHRKVNGTWSLIGDEEA